MGVHFIDLLRRQAFVAAPSQHLCGKVEGVSPSLRHARRWAGEKRVSFSELTHVIGVEGVFLTCPAASAAIRACLPLWRLEVARAHQLADLAIAIT